MYFKSKIWDLGDFFNYCFFRESMSEHSEQYYFEKQYFQISFHWRYLILITSNRYLRLVTQEILHSFLEIWIPDDSLYQKFSLETEINYLNRTSLSFPIIAPHSLPISGRDSLHTTTDLLQVNWRKGEKSVHVWQNLQFMESGWFIIP